MEGILSGLELKLMEQGLWKYFEYTKRISCERLALLFAVQSVVRRSKRCSPFRLRLSLESFAETSKFKQSLFNHSETSKDGCIFSNL